MGERLPVVIDGSVVDEPPADDEEDAIDLDDWAAGDDVEARLLKIAKQMEKDAMAMRPGDALRGPLLRDAANIFWRLAEKGKVTEKGGLGGVAAGKGGVAVVQSSRDDAVGAYMRLIEAPEGGE